MADAPRARPAASGRLLLLVFIAALLPRLWALDWGMPLKRGHIDEAVVVFYSLRVVSGDANPRVFFDYPAFFLYALAALFKGALAAARLLGQAVPANADVFDAYTRGDGLLFLLGLARLVNAVLGALTAAVIARFGARRWSPFVGLAAALLWSVNALAVRHAHYAMVDTPAVFLFLLAVERLVEYGEEGIRRDGLWAALLIGLGAATKYYPAALLLFLIMIPLLRREWGTAAVLGGASALAFLAASPYTLLEPAAFAGRFMHLFPKIVGGDRHFLIPTLRGLFSNMGVFSCLAAFVGVVLLLRSASTGDRILAGVILFFLLFLGSWSVQAPHYALPLYPLLFLGSGCALAALSRWRRVLPPGGLAILMALSLPRTAATLERLSEPDTRLHALAWARETFPSGSRVLRFAHTPEFTPRDPFQVTVDWENRRLGPAPGALAADGFDYLIYGSYDPADPFPAALAGRYALLKKFDNPAPDFPHHPSVYIYGVVGVPPTLPSPTRGEGKKTYEKT